ncbi:hypothetical protein CKA32_003738 [Geitlerinema sp. FC II]|nr:hypothetical protein [Geitlerinema sp. CS-897]PPT10517.1 hypothetical protein CKA32_003738 [Geitlerinema sp. FC II]
MNDVNWSTKEKEAAREAFDKAYTREIESLVEEVRQKVAHISEIDEIWKLHDFLSAKRHEIDGKYDYSYSALIFIFSQLLKEGWLTLEELHVLDREKLAKISALARM